MSRIDCVFADPGRKALITYFTVGYPDMATTREMVQIAADAGSDLVELGIPFSDPLADGSTIQQASHRSLERGTTPKSCLELARTLRVEVGVPLVFMTYFNPVHRYGQEAFCRDCAQAGIDGLIVPDLPPEEGAELEALSQGQGLDLVYLLAPTSTDERIDIVAARSRGFIYLVSLTGVTGARDSLPVDLESFVTRVRRRARQPLCVGFGISTPKQATQVASVADGVIVGSRLMRLLEEEDPAAGVRGFIQSLRRALSDHNGNPSGN
jgi:tryptophan synthase alpha chain